MAALLVLALGLGSCSDDTPSVFCPTLNDQGPVLDPAHAWLLVAHGLSEEWEAVRLDGGAPAVVPERGLTGEIPNGLDVVGDRLYIVNSGNNTVSVVDLPTGRTVGCIGTGTGTNPWEFVVDPTDSSRAWVTTFLTGEVLELDLDRSRVRRRREVGPAAEGLWVGEDHVAVTLTGFNGEINSYENGTVVVLEKSGLAETARVPVPPNPQFLLRGADGRLHAVCTGNFVDIPGQVVRLTRDLSAARDTLVLGGTPGRAILAPDHTVYLAGFFGGLTSYNSSSFTVGRDSQNPILSETGLTDLAIRGDTLYVSRFDQDTVKMVNLATLLPAGEIALSGDGPGGLAVWGE
jgi:YVTN family beta-propeller protein